MDTSGQLRPVRGQFRFFPAQPLRIYRAVCWRNREKSYLVILEVLSPGAFFLWLAISAGIVGVLVLLNPGMTWEYQILAFALFSVVSITGVAGVVLRFEIL